MPKLSRDFFLRNPHVVALDLLGTVLSHHDSTGNDVTSGMITEVEVYEAFVDKSAHSYSGKTKRNEALFLQGGHLYLHKIHNQICLDIVTEDAGIPSSVLIRSLEPLSGIYLMKKRRNQDDIKNLTTGPGKLTQALGISMDLNKVDLCSHNSQIQILIGAEQRNTDQIHKTTRIGISKDVEKMNRYYIKGSAFISRK